MILSIGYKLFCVYLVESSIFLTPKMKLDACGAYFLLLGTQIEYKIYFQSFIRVGSLLICLRSRHFLACTLVQVLLKHLNHGGNVI